MRRAGLVVAALAAGGCQVILGIEDHTLAGGGGGSGGGASGPGGGGSGAGVVGGGGGQGTGGENTGGGGAPPMLMFGTPSEVVSGLGVLTDIERDAANGDLFVLASGSNGAIVKLVGATQTTLASGLSNPVGLGLSNAEVLTATRSNGTLTVRAFLKSDGTARAVASANLANSTTMSAFAADDTRWVLADLLPMGGKRSELRGGASSGMGAPADLVGFGVDKMSAVPSVAMHQGALYWLDSKKDAVYSNADAGVVDAQDTPPGTGVDLIAGGFTGGVEIAWSDATLYVATSNSIRRVEGSSTTSLTSAASPTALAADSRFAYWADGSALHAYELATGATGIVDSVPGVSDITSDASDVIFATAGGAVVRVPKP